MSLDQHKKELLVEVDNYEATVTAMRALANELLWQDQARIIGPGSIHCGRRFTTSENNRHSKGREVTPDLAIVPSGKPLVIAEAKLGFERQEDLYRKRLDETVTQIEKYDDDLTGWPQSCNDRKSINHDIVLIVDILDANKVSRELTEQETSGTLRIVRNLAIISYFTNARAGGGEWPTIRLERGKLADVTKNRKLEDGIPIDPNRLAQSKAVSLIQLCDCEPPLPVMMHLVHRAVVQNLTAEEQEQYNIEGQVDKVVSVANVRRWISSYAFPRTDDLDPPIPHEQWVKRALNKLVDMEWAEDNRKQKDTVIYHHHVRTNVLQRFIAVCAKDRAKAEDVAAKRLQREEQKTTAYRERQKAKTPLFAEQLDEELKKSGKAR